MSDAESGWGRGTGMRLDASMDEYWMRQSLPLDSTAAIVHTPTPEHRWGQAEPWGSLRLLMRWMKLLMKEIKVINKSTLILVLWIQNPKWRSLVLLWSQAFLHPSSYPSMPFFDFWAKETARSFSWLLEIYSVPSFPPASLSMLVVDCCFWHANTHLLCAGMT